MACLYPGLRDQAFFFTSRWFVSPPAMWNITWFFTQGFNSDIAEEHLCLIRSPLSVHTILMLSLFFLQGVSQAQCSPVPLPALGTQRIIQGNGTTVGTVISLQCPAKHRLFGSEMMCVMDNNNTYWTGETYCKRKQKQKTITEGTAPVCSSGLLH